MGWTGGHPLMNDAQCVHKYTTIQSTEQKHIWHVPPLAKCNLSPFVYVQQQQQWRVQRPSVYECIFYCCCNRWLDQSVRGLNLCVFVFCRTRTSGRVLLHKQIAIVNKFQMEELLPEIYKMSTARVVTQYTCPGCAWICICLMQRWHQRVASAALGVAVLMDEPTAIWTIAIVPGAWLWWPFVCGWAERDRLLKSFIYFFLFLRRTPNQPEGFIEVELFGGSGEPRRRRASPLPPRPPTHSLDFSRNLNAI